jgi:hypothetical protein
MIKMKKLRLTKIISSTLAIASVLVSSPIGANAEWKQDNKGWWYEEGDSWATGWRNISGNWYYFNKNGYMVKEKDVDGWYLDDSGVGTECIKIDGFDILKSTGTIVKFSRNVPWGPGKSGIPLVIPREIGGIEIKSIGNGAFYDCEYLTSITIPDSVTSIGDNAFERCVSFTNITIPDGVTSIGSNAFSRCTSLKNITIPNSVKNIGVGAFYGCYNLISMTIPDGITSINEWVFGGCTSLTNVKIPDSVISIRQSAFVECKSLTDIIIPNSVTSLDETVFSNCSSLTSITIPDSVGSIGREAFYGCDNAMFYIENERTKQYLTKVGIAENRIILITK